MEARRRQASTSTQHSHDERAQGDTKGSGTATPVLDDEEDGKPRRATRGRNPLPPTTGPLFPPLPPKQPKNSPKASPKAPSRSPAGRAPRLASSSALSHVMADNTANSENGDGPASPNKPNIAPSMSSLSPPPGDGDEMDIDEPPSDPKPASSSSPDKASSGAGKETGGDDWDAYRRGRGVRGFFGPKSAPVKVEPVEPTEPVDTEEAIDADDADAARSEEPQEEESAAEAAAPTDAAPAPAASESAAPADTAADPTSEEKANGNGNGNGTGPSPEPASAAASSTSNSAEPTASQRAGRKRRGEEQLLLDDHLLPKELRVHREVPPRRDKSDKSSKRSEPTDEPEPENEEPEEEAKEPEAEEAEKEADDDDADDDDLGEDDDGEEITRCVCKREDIEVMMIQCDKCKVWQHGECMGIWGDDEAPDEYFCEECRPDLHGPLRKWIRSRGRNPANFIAPTPEDLRNLHNASDRHPPSQSKRWTDPELMDPPPPPVKPPSRSHNRKAQDDDDRRPTRGRDRGSERGAQPARDPKAAISSKDGGRDRRRGANNRRQSTDMSVSMSPPPGVHREAKKRSTMNSRDAAYEEAVKAALEASRREMSGSREKEEPPEDRKRRRAEDNEVAEEVKKGKKRKEDDETSEQTPAPAPAKPKHPNQYTYRPKPGGGGSGAIASPARRGAGTPQPSGPPPSHDHGTRRAGAIASNLASAPYTAVSIHNLNWFVPDHLSSYIDLFPTPNPVPLVVPTSRSLQFLPRNHFLNQRYGPFKEDKDETGKLIMPEERPLRDTDGEAVNHREPPTRVRYPMKRVSTAEMTKRVRNVLEYVGRVQSDEARRLERSQLIKIPSELAARPKLPPLEVELNGDKGKGRATVDDSNDVDVEMHDDTHPEEPTPPLPSSSQLLDELTRDLIAFQEACQTGDFSELTFVSPMPVEDEPPFIPSTSVSGAVSGAASEKAPEPEMDVADESGGDSRPPETEAAAMDAAAEAGEPEQSAEPAVAQELERVPETEPEAETEVAETEPASAAEAEAVTTDVAAAEAKAEVEPAQAEDTPITTPPNDVVMESETVSVSAASDGKGRALVSAVETADVEMVKQEEASTAAAALSEVMV